MFCVLFFFFNDTATTEIYTLSLHDALPIFTRPRAPCARRCKRRARGGVRSEEHTSELQSRGLISYAVFCLKKKTRPNELPILSSAPLLALDTAPEWLR